MEGHAGLCYRMTARVKCTKHEQLCIWRGPARARSRNAGLTGTRRAPAGARAAAAANPWPRPNPARRGAQDVLDYLAWSGREVAGARLLRAQPREALPLQRTLAEAGVGNMETLVVEV